MSNGHGGMCQGWGHCSPESGKAIIWGDKQ